MTDVLVGLSDEALAIRRQLVAVANVLHGATLGVTHPHGTRIGERIRAPRVGDYVYEASLPFRLNPTPEQIAHGCGYLLRVTQEPMYEPGVWDEKVEGGPAPTEDVWYIQYGPVTETQSPTNPDVVRWVDCRFVTVPINGEPS